MHATEGTTCDLRSNEESDVTAATSTCFPESFNLAVALPLGSRDEAAVTAASAPVAVAFAALIDCCAAPHGPHRWPASPTLSPRCRARPHAGTPWASTCWPPGSGDGFSAKDEADLADDDIKVLVFGSKLVGGVQGSFATAVDRRPGLRYVAGLRWAGCRLARLIWFQRFVGLRLDLKCTAPMLDYREKLICPTAEDLVPRLIG